MSIEAETDYAPVRVHVASSDVGSGQAAGPRLRYATVYSVVKLTANDPVQEILPQSDKRVVAFIQSLDDDTWIGNAFGQAQNSNGSLLPKANGSPWPVMDSGPVFAGNNSGTFSGSGSVSRITITATYEA